MMKSSFNRLFILAIILVLPNISKADFCFKSFEEDSTVAKAIFVGKVVKIEKGQFWHRGLPTTIFTFEVLESFKGLKQRVSHLSLIGPINGCCNVHYEIDSTFLVFAYSDCENSNILWTNDCSNTGLLSEEMVHYKKLGTPIQHKTHNDEFDFYSSEQKLVSSLEKDVYSLNQQIKSTEISKAKLTTQRNALLLIVGILMTIILSLVFTRKKRNANTK